MGLRRGEERTASLRAAATGGAIRRRRGEAQEFASGELIPCLPAGRPAARQSGFIKSCMKIWIAKNWFRLVITLAGFLAASGIFYYYVLFIPQGEYDRQQKELQAQIEEKEKEADAQRKIEAVKASTGARLTNCLRTADENLTDAFYALCVGDEKIGGSAEKCPTDDKESIISYMTVQQDRYPYFKYLLEKRGT
ncbi:MAG: hypothetical protein Q8R35_04075, partial [bacterium]|nr:hypothetical protein [bacterium]